jgi:integrase
MPTWKGWHAFRRGNATHLAKNFGNADGIEAASRVLRHSDPGVTASHYVVESKQNGRARAAAKLLGIERQKHQAAGVLAHGLRSVRKQSQIN